MHNPEYWMNKALQLAKKGEGLTSPNPPVGAVIVSDNKIVGRGYHSKAGGPHAEIVALKSAGNKSHGATLYVTLEPCSTTGRTPPCTASLISSGLRKVVVASKDPNPLHNGRGSSILKKAGIIVQDGVCKEKADELIRPFQKWITTGLPFLTLKMGISLDGQIADYKGESQWLTCEKSRVAVQDIRSKSDAILVGARTAKIDNPSLLLKGTLYKNRVNPLRIVVDSSGQLNGNERILRDNFASRTIIATTSACSKTKIKRYQDRGADVWIIPASKDGVSIPLLMSRLGKHGVLRVLCEGGGCMAHSLVKAQLVDEYVFFVAPILLGGTQSVPVIGGKGWPLKSAPLLKYIEITRKGSDIMIKAVPVSK